MAQMQKCLKECADTDRFADTNAETLAVVRAETYADAGAVRRAVCRADVRAYPFAECRAVVGADAYAEKNGSDAKTLAEIGANCLCRKMAQMQTLEQRLTVQNATKGLFCIEMVRLHSLKYKIAPMQKPVQYIVQYPVQNLVQSFVQSLVQKFAPMYKHLQRHR